MNPAELIGALAGVLTTVAFVPQVVKIWRSGTAEDISLLTFSLYSAGLLLWLLYGIALNSLPLMAANGITFLLTLSVLALKLRHMRRKRHALAAAGERAL
ncbi:MAG: SemiSWEET family sugar transporter [Gammaproteobacteria bacterium]|nr:SemiSWEET family sugar transporter [Gammaproteobacteria bacterium]